MKVPVNFDNISWEIHQSSWDGIAFSELDVKKILFRKEGALEHVTWLIDLEQKIPSHSIFSELAIYEVYSDFDWSMIKQMVSGHIQIFNLRDFMRLENILLHAESLWLEQLPMPTIEMMFQSKQKQTQKCIDLLTAPKLNKRRKITEDDLRPYIPHIKHQYAQRLVDVIHTYIDAERFLFDKDYYSGFTQEERDMLIDFFTKNHVTVTKEKAIVHEETPLWL